MELKSPRVTALTIKTDRRDYMSGDDMIDGVKEMIESLLKLKECIDNSVTIMVTIDVTIGPDSMNIDQNPILSGVPQVGDRVIVTSRTARLGLIDLYGLNGTVEERPNEHTDAYMIRFPSLTESVLMFEYEFDVTIPFPAVEVAS